VPAQCARANEDHVTKSARDELDTAENERPHEDLAQLGVGLHEGKKVFAIELDDIARLGDAQPGQSPAARNHCAFAGELPAGVQRSAFQSRRMAARPESHP
jgi:hypothetical protein